MRHTHSPTRRSCAGLTALDLAIGLAIAAVVIALAVPALQNLAMNRRMQAATTTLHASLALARAAAIDRAARVVLCPTDGFEACNGLSRWQYGWLVFEDRNDDRQYQPAEPLLQRGNPLEHLDIVSSVHRTRLRFFPNGTAPGSNATITFCDRRGPQAARQLVLSASGRITRRAPGDIGSAGCIP